MDAAASARHRRAVGLCRAGMLAEGEAELRELCARYPDDAQVLRHLVDVLNARGDTAEEARQAAALTVLTPCDANAHQCLGVALHAQGRLEEAAQSYLAAARLDAAEPLSVLGLGDVLADLGRHDEALAAYDDALRRRPGWPQALGNAGLALLALGRLEEALEMQRRAVAADPSYGPGWTDLGGALQRLGHLDQAVAAYERAVALAPGDAMALSNLAQALDERGEMRALDGHRVAVAAAPDNATAHFNLGIALLRHGQWADGWREYGWRWRGGVAALRPRPFTQPAWDGGSLDGRTLLLHAEQGLGDTLQFVRFARDAAARGGRVVLEAPPQLVRLLRGVPGVDAVVAAGDELPPFDLHLPLMSLPGVLALGGDDFARDVPYLAADPNLAIEWAVRLGPRTRRRIGLAWSGNPRHRADRQRSMPARLLVEALASDHVELVSLQMPARDEDRSVLFRLTDLTAGVRDFADTAALAVNLDMVVAVDTAVAHLAGALGLPVVLLLAHAGEWRWGRGGGTTPWYPSMRLIRQTHPGDWAGVVARLNPPG